MCATSASSVHAKPRIKVQWRRTVHKLPMMAWKPRNRGGVVMSLDRKLLYCPSAVGLHALRGDTGKVAWEFVVGDAVEGSPVEVDGVVHYCVANMPGAVPRTSTFALSNATLPWIIKLANLGVKDAIDSSPELASAANTIAGQLTCVPVAAAFDIDMTDPREAARAL